jgi:hypothetical protein
MESRVEAAPSMRAAFSPNSAQDPVDVVKDDLDPARFPRMAAPGGDVDGAPAGQPLANPVVRGLTA